VQLGQEADQVLQAAAQPVLAVELRPTAG